MSQQRETDAQILMPPKEVFEGMDIIQHTMMGAGKSFYVYERMETPPSGGIYVYYKGMPYPKKGFPYPEAVQANDMMKQFIMVTVKSVATKDLLLPIFAFLILPWRIKKRVIKRFLEHYGRISMWLLQGTYLKENAYSDSVRKIRKIVRIFIDQLDVKMAPENEAEIPKMMSNIFEYDDAYRYRLQDLMTEASQWALIDRPYREIRRLAKIAKERELTHAVRGISAFTDILAICMLHPKVRKAFTRAIRSLTPTEFKELQLDNSDRYHVLLRNDYNFLGRTFNERVKLYEDVHRVSKCCKAKVTAAIGTDWFCNKCKRKCDVELLLPEQVEII